MLRKSLIVILWLAAILCFYGVFASKSWIESYMGQTADYKYLKGSNPEPINTSLWSVLFYALSAVALVPRICIIVFFGVGALVSGSFALWKTLRSPKKSNLPAPQTQTEGGSSESPQTQFDGSRNRSGPPPLPPPPIPARRIHPD